MASDTRESLKARSGTRGGFEVRTRRTRPARRASGAERVGLSPGASRDIRTLAERIEERVTGTGGGKDLLARWTQDGDLDSSSITDSAGVVTIEARVVIRGGGLVLDNSRAINWLNVAGGIEIVLFLDTNDDFDIYDGAMFIEGTDKHVVMGGTVSAFRWHRVTDTQRDAIPNPTRGHSVYDTDTNSFQGYFATSDTPGAGVWGPIAEFPSFAFGSRLTATTTTITTINVAVQVAGAMTASGSELLWTLDTTGSVSKWTYTGPDRILPLALAFELSAQKAGGGTPETFSFSIRVNNVDVGLPAIFSGRQNEPAQVRAVAYIALSTSDVVTFFVKNTVGTSNVIVNDQAFAAKA